MHYSLPTWVPRLSDKAKTVRAKALQALCAILALKGDSICSNSSSHSSNGVSSASLLRGVQTRLLQGSFAPVCRLLEVPEGSSLYDKTSHQVGVVKGMSSDHLLYCQQKFIGVLHSS